MSHTTSEKEPSANMHPKDFRTTFVSSLCEEAINQAIIEFKTSFMNPMAEEYISQIMRTKDTYKESIKSLTEMLTRKYMEDQLMAEKILESHSDFLLYNKRTEEKQAEWLEVVAKFKQSKEYKAEQVKRIQSLKEESNKKRTSILANKKDIKDRLEELEKSAVLFRERLGLEIRKLRDGTLQFVFRYINAKAPHEAYTFILRINEAEQYEVVSCDPPLECTSELQRKVRETNNFSAFLANFRKAFTVLACNGKEM